MLDSKRLDDIYYELEEMAKAEQMKLFRMARRLLKHGGSVKLAAEIRNEAYSLTDCRVGDLLDPFRKYKFAFRN